jgi:hypothetical protein
MLLKAPGMQLGVERNLHVEMPEEASFLLKEGMQLGKNGTIKRTVNSKAEPTFRSTSALDEKKVRIT